MEDRSEPVPATTHGGRRLDERGWTEAEYLAAKAARHLQQADGADVFVVRVRRNRYNVIVESEGRVVTAIKRLTPHELRNLAKNYGWH